MSSPPAAAAAAGAGAGVVSPTAPTPVIPQFVSPSVFLKDDDDKDVGYIRPMDCDDIMPKSPHLSPRSNTAPDAFASPQATVWDDFLPVSPVIDAKAPAPPVKWTQETLVKRACAEAAHYAGSLFQIAVEDCTQFTKDCVQNALSDVALRSKFAQKSLKFEDVTFTIRTEDARAYFAEKFVEIIDSTEFDENPFMRLTTAEERVNATREIWAKTQPDLLADHLNAFISDIEEVWFTRNPKGLTFNHLADRIKNLYVAVLEALFAVVLCQCAQP
jgi:hypothetical protein